MTEQQQKTLQEWVEYLVEEIGTSRQEAELRMLDDDLWILHPGSRYAFPAGEESVEEWDRAADALEGLYWASQSLGNRAFKQAISDAHERAIAALYRARQRASE